MRTILTRGRELEARLATLTPDDRPRWGTMTASEMLAHLADACRLTLGERPARPIPLPVPRFIFRWFALYTPLSWPQNFATVPEVDQREDGTPPTTFAQDRATVLALLSRIAREKKSCTHPHFGPMTAADWHIHAYRHTDHHLRQFNR